MTTETGTAIEDTDLFVAFASNLKDQIDAVRLEVTEKPGDLLLALSKRVGTLTPALETLCAKITEKALVDNDFRAADDLSEMIINTLKNDRIEMLPALMAAYKKAVPHNWLWPTGPNAPRIEAKDVASKPMPFFYLATSSEAINILLDESAKDTVNYQQALSDSIVRHLESDNTKVLEPLVAAYKKADPEKWSWPLGSSIDAKGIPFLPLAKNKAVELFIDPAGSPASAYHQALSNALFYFIEKGSSAALGIVLHAYQKIRPDHWQEPMQTAPDKESFLLWAAWRDRVEATKLLLDEGADPNKTFGSNFSPLFAALHGFIPGKNLPNESASKQVAHLLLDKNADPTAESVVGKTTYSCRKLIKYSRDKDLLRKADSVASASRPADTSWYWAMRRTNPAAKQ